ENYRPVTVLSCVDKVFEKLLAKQITINFEECLADGLTAYRKNNSCETTLVSLVESWRLAMDNRQCTSILSTDMSKAFDSLHPPLMLSKLKAYGFEDNAINLLRSYLCDRYNRVRIGSLTSSFKCTSRGCPQGSALGPLLWNIFQNDMTYNITSSLSMYADDHQIYEMGADLHSVTTKLKESAALATEWYDSNLLEGNLKKYQTMNICSNGANQYHTDVIKIKNTEISPSNSLNLLGVTIDDKLSFRDHITTVCKKASQRIGVIMRLKNLIPTKAKLQLYKAAILPHLIFCHLVWHFCRASDTRRLERIQERGLRAVFKDDRSSYEVLLKRAELPTLKNRRLQDICILMYKVKNGLSPNPIRQLFKPHQSSYQLRQSDFSMPRFTTVTYGKHSIRYLGPKLWGHLTTDERNCQSLKTFKKTIRKRDFNNFLNNERCNCRLCDY
ncbi:hypothetical protein ACROYT_G037423, partial [Oculina patagonica]